ncbi:MAG: amino acid adenylation domain-containing protein [Flavobacteriales bacterium]
MFEKSKYIIQGTKIDYPKSTLHELLEKCSQKYPNAFALQFNDEKISYGELQKRINQTSNYLWELGVRPGQIIAISLDRKPELIISIFAVLQCGAVYLPIDTGYPLKRLEMIITDSNANFLISNSSRGILTNESKNIFIEDILTHSENFTAKSLDLKVSTESGAYIIYTSGSTGKPKGVQVAHQNAINLVYSMAKEPGVKPNDKIFAITTISFDAMVMEIFLPLLMGACVVLVDEETRLDGQILLDKAYKEDITLIWGTPSIWRILLDSGWEKPLKIKALIGGEQVPRPLALELLERCDELWNIYGPTETTVCSFLTKISKDDDPITIGKPIANTYAYLLNKERNPVNIGEIGEIVIGGDGVSLGYLNRIDLNNERFLNDPFNNATDDAKMYLSGDLGKLLPNGHVQCLGRIDNQVKIRGHRIELGEIESNISKLPDIKKAVVIVSDQLGSEPKLVAYIQSKGLKDAKIIRKQLEEILPDYLIPAIFMWVDEFPVTTNGKIDIKRLPTPEYIRPDSAPLFRKPRTELEKNIEKIWKEHLQIPAIGIDDNFFEMGGSSILTQKVATIMRKQLSLQFHVTKIYQYPTIASFSEFIHQENKTSNLTNTYTALEKKSHSDIAIIGMAGRFPGANTIKELWKVLKEGKETISFFTEDELDSFISKSLTNDPLYVRARGTVPSAKTFDAAFFGINPKLAEAMDPQQRLFLEIAWEILEQSGYLPNSFNNNKYKIGVYAGTGTNTYFKNNIHPNEELINDIGVMQVNSVNEKDYIASRTAYHLNLKGPAVSVQSACSTSLLAVATAVEAIRNNQCEMALAGGSSVTAPINSGHLYQEGSMLSADGHCRPFDADAKGTVFSDGAGIVLLKSLEAAENDGDKIYGIIKGVGVNNDGGYKGSFTAPSATGQADVIKKALTDAQIAPNTLSYIETHGTATPIGDPIEFEGLQMAFGEQDSKNYCAIGSIKSNMGHLTAAAGVTGLIKTVLAMHYKQIPPSLGFEKPNPAIDFENSPFYVNSKLSPWKSETLRRAGVSSFGVGGTNVHVILEEYQNKNIVSGSGRPFELLTWSAKTQNSVLGYKSALGHYLKDNSDIPLADVAYSLHMTRDNFSHRSFILSKSNTDASENLINTESKSIKNHILKLIPEEIAFLYTGQGAQYLQMGRSLYENEKVYRDAIDVCAELLRDNLELDIRDIIFPDASSNLKELEEKLNNTKFTQPALFATEYALTQLWLSWGIKPTLLCGHSIGEFVAAHISGVFSLKDALHLIATRGKLMSELPKGSMLSVRMPIEKLEFLVPKSLSIAAINSSQSCVVAGHAQDIEAFEKTLISHDVTCKILATSHAFHSFMMDPILASFKFEVDKIEKNIPRIPIVSTATGTWLSDSEALNSDYWTNHLRHTVLFGNAVSTILELEDPILLEIGPGHTLTTLARQQSAGKILTAFASLPSEIKDMPHNDYQTLLNTLGSLWLHGLSPDWKSFYSQQQRQKINLPSYVFDKKLCWIDPPITKKETTLKHFNNTVNTNSPIDTNINMMLMRKNSILNKISEIVSLSSGIDYQPEHASYSFIELGLDSLALTQLSLKLKKEFNLPITFRQLNEEFGSPDLLADYIDKNTAAEETHVNNVVHTNPNPVNPVLNVNTNQPGSLDLIQQQIQLLSMQINLMQGNNLVNNTNLPTFTNNSVSINHSPKNTSDTDILSEEEKKELKKPFGASPKIEKQSTELNDAQLKFLKNLQQTYNEKTQKSKDYAQKYRSIMSDPRVVTGFKPLTKEMVYPLVIKKSSGNRLWDLDNNEYIDALNGFGSCMLGHQPDFIKQALHDQIEQGYEVGPQHPLAGEVCELLCEFTGHERAALCNTGSEAVLGAIRIARTITGRSLIVSFSGSYHGINDEALVRGSKKLKTFPAAAGILSDAVQNVLVLEYGTDESLNIIKERAHEIAAVLAEPVQSRRPEFQPIDFLKALRNITEKSNTLLIFDEVITGFRSHPGGVQALFGIKADIATYGKVIGGGISIGAILGKREYMDALDGGFWQYGDQSSPEVGVTYFAGTFVRHPLALAATKASLTYLKEQGPSLQKNLNAMTESFVEKLKDEFQNRRLPITITHFSSLWRIKFLEDIPYSELLFVLLRKKGIHIMDGFPCFMTTVYTQKDVDYLTSCILESIDEMATVGIFVPKTEYTAPNGHSKNVSTPLNVPPVPGARLGRDEMGNPAWFIEDVNNKNTYVKISL